jgi:hypothetical protein
VPLLVQPGGEVNGDGRFADTAFGICDHDNHDPDTTTPAGTSASIMCITLESQNEGIMAVRHDSTYGGILSGRQVSK